MKRDIVWKLEAKVRYYKKKMNFLQLNVKCTTTKIHFPSHHIGGGALSRLENNLEGNICMRNRIV